MQFLNSWMLSLWAIMLESGVWLLAGFLAAGLVHVFVPVSWISRHLAGRGRWPVVKAALLGIPLPLCSCAVIPAAAGLRRQGASKGAAASFAISTPETGEESVALTWGLLGPVMALTRPIAAIATAIAAGWAIDALVKDDKPAPRPPAPSPAGSCCEDDACQDADAAAERKARVSRLPLTSRLRESLRFALVEMPADLAPWLIPGLLLSALIGALVPAEWIAAHLGGGLLPMLAMLALSLPLYICASASTPVAAVLVAKGLSPGAALVLLLAGPATNIATMAWVLKDLGSRALVIYVLTIATIAVALGLAFDAAIRRLFPADWVWAISTEAIERAGPVKIAGALLASAVLIAPAVRATLAQYLKPRTRA